MNDEVRTLSAEEFLRLYASGERIFRKRRFGFGVVSNCSVEGVDFSGSFINLHWIEVTFANCVFGDGCHFAGDYTSGEASKCSFAEGHIASRFTQVKVVDCDFGHTDCRLRAKDCQFIGNTTFEGARFWDAGFESCSFGEHVLFRRAQFGKDTQMDPQTFGSIADGAITSWQESGITLVDDAVTLRRSFTGLKRTLYLVLFSFFLGPYVLFVARKWLLGRAMCSADVTTCGPLYKEVGRFLLQGGAAAVLSFILVLCYHLLRTALVAKASSLEVESSARGTRVRFELKEPVFKSWEQLRHQAAGKRLAQELNTGSAPPASFIERMPILRWKHLVALVAYGFWLNAILLAYHSWEFLRTMVPQ